MAKSGKSNQAGVRYRRPPTNVRNLPAGTVPAESGVGAEEIAPLAAQWALRVGNAGLPFGHPVPAHRQPPLQQIQARIPDGSPDLATASLRPAAARIEHRHLGLVHDELVDSFQAPRQPVGDRHQMERSRADPASPFQVLLS